MFPWETVYVTVQKRCLCHYKHLLCASGCSLLIVHTVISTDSEKACSDCLCVDLHSIWHTFSMCWLKSTYYRRSVDLRFIVSPTITRFINQQDLFCCQSSFFSQNPLFCGILGYSGLKSKLERRKRVRSMAILVDSHLFSFQAGPRDEQAGGTAFTDPLLWAVTDSRLRWSSSLSPGPSLPPPAQGLISAKFPTL